MQAAGLETTSLNLLRASTPNPEAANTLIKWMALHPAEADPGDPSDFPVSANPPSETSPPASSNPQSAIRIPQAYPTPFRQLAAAVDESGYALGAWVIALLAAHGWLAERHLRANFGDTLEYVRCCATAAAGGNVPLTDLRSTVLEMLDAYGIDAAHPIP